MKLRDFSEVRIREAIANSYCYHEICSNLAIPINGRSNRAIKEFISANNVNVSHFDEKRKVRKHVVVKKSCPICEREFSTKLGAKGEKTTCSYKCANVHFRSGDQNGRRAKKLERIASGEQELTYAEICWQHHKRECVVCGECLIVEAHHYNDKHNDNRPENFAPLCPTHHQYWHSRHRHLIQERVDNYVKNFITS